MKTRAARRRIMQGAGALLALALFLSIATGAGASAWTSYLDPSWISEIVLHDGELYLATNGGMVVYDPATGDIDQYTNTIGLASTFLTCLAFHPGGDIYVGTEDAGIARLQPVAGGFDVSTLTATFHGLSDDRITSVAAWGDTIVYGSQKGAGLIVQGFATVRFLQKDGLPSDFIYDVQPNGDFVWIATDSGVVYLDRFGFLNDASAGLPSDECRVLQAVDTTMWVGTSAGVAWWDDNVDQWVPGGIATDPVFSMAFDGQTLWAASHGKLYGNAGGGWSEHSYFELYSKYDLNNTISETRGLQPMPNGDLYLGVAGPSGERRGVNLVRYDGSTFEDIPFNAPPMNTLLRLSFDIDGSLWVSSSRFGVGKLMPDGRWLNHTIATGNTELNTRFFNLTCLADRGGTKWFATLSTPNSRVPMNELRDNQDDDPTNDVWVEHDIDSGGGDGLGSLRAVMAVEDPMGNRWFLSDAMEAASEWWGINILSEDKSEWKRINPTTTGGAMLAGSVTDVAFDPAGIAYVALKDFGVQQWFPGDFSKASLFDLSNDSWTTLGRIGDEFGSDLTIETIARRDEDGSVWIGTTDGVYKYDLDLVGFRHITANRGFGIGLLGPRVRDIVFDRDGNVWLATDLGLNRISRDDDFDIASFTTAAAWQNQLSLFFPPDVVSPLAYADLAALALHPTRNELYIATAGGLSVLDLGSLTPPSQSFSDLYVYPNPIRVEAGESGVLKIGNLTRPVVVDIYTIEGEKVKSISVSEDGDTIWDLRTLAGIRAAAGVYIVRISDGTQAVVKTVAVLQ